MKTGNINWRVNNQIRAQEVRVIGSDGGQLGVMKLDEALKKSREEELDLVEIAPTAKPPVTKIVDLGKFKYEQEKKLKKQNKKTKASDLKEIRFSPFIADHDFNNRAERIREFLDNKHKIRAVVVFKGRQMGSKNFGYDILNKLLDTVGKETVAIDMEPKFFGRHLAMVISPLNKPVKPKEEENKE